MYQVNISRTDPGLKFGEGALYFKKQKGNTQLKYNKSKFKLNLEL